MTAAGQNFAASGKLALQLGHFIDASRTTERRIKAATVTCLSQAIRSMHPRVSEVERIGPPRKNPAPSASRPQREPPPEEIRAQSRVPRSRQRRAEPVSLFVGGSPSP
jgi:hypothetical protein